MYCFRPYFTISLFINVLRYTREVKEASVGSNILKQDLYPNFDLPQNCFRAAFNNRTLREDGNIKELNIWLQKLTQTNHYSQYKAIYKWLIDIK